MNTAHAPEADPRALEREIEQIRDEMGVLIGELDRRRHEITDVKLQAQRHPVAAGVAVAAGALAVWLVVGGIVRALRPEPAAERAQKLARALSIAVRDPDKLLQVLQGRHDPTAALLSALASAAVKAAAASVTPAAR